MAEPNDVARDAPNDAAKMLPSPYMSALDLPAGKPVTMTVKHLVEMTFAERPGIKNEKSKPVLYVNEASKGIICGAKNLKALLTRFQSRDWKGVWVGQKITVLVEIDKIGGGKMGPCVRISPVPPIQGGKTSTETP